MDETLNLSGARFKKRCGCGEKIHRFYVDERAVRVNNKEKKKKTNKKGGCSKNIRICVEPGLTAPGFPRILTVNYLSKEDSRRLGSSVLVMLEKMAEKKKRTAA